MQWRRQDSISGRAHSDERLNILWLIIAREGLCELIKLFGQKSETYDVTTSTVL